MDYSETHYMDIALSLAKEALDAQEVPVGCVFVYKSDIIAKGRNTVNETRNPTRHAELNCIDDAIELCKRNDWNFKEVLNNLSVFVTVEPCIMCAEALHAVGVLDVTFGCANDRFGGSTVFDVSTLHEKTYSLKGGVKGDQAMDLLKQFYKGTNPMAPENKVKKKKN